MSEPVFLSRAFTGGIISLPPVDGPETATGTPVPRILTADVPSQPDALGTVKDEQGRRTWNVIARKLPYAQRDVARSVMPDETAVSDRSFQSIGQAALADDNDKKYPVGSTTTYSLKLTDDEAKRFKAASNAIDVSLAIRMTRPPFVWGP